MIYQITEHEKAVIEGFAKGIQSGRYSDPSWPTTAASQVLKIMDKAQGIEDVKTIRDLLLEKKR